MKKKWILALLFASMLFALSACGKKAEEKVEEKTENNEEMEVESYNVDDYVTELGNYKGLEYEKRDVEPTEEEVKAELDAFLAKHPEKVTDRAVAKGDTANIDFVGKKDGVPFEGGKAEGFNLVIGSGKFIPGFEDGLIGHKTGETVDLNLKFPDTYHAEELKGAAVVFTVKINHIETPPKELTDEMVAKSTDVKTVAEFKAKVKKEIYDRKKISARNLVHGELLKQVIKASKIKEIPESLMKSYQNDYIQYYEGNAKANKMSLEDYLKKVWNMTVEDMKKNAAELAKNMSEQKLIVEAIAKKEKFDTTEEEYKVELEEYYKESGYATKMDKETFEKTVGKQNIKNVVLAKKVLKLLEENGKEK